MQIIDGYTHQAGSHCETGTTRNLLAKAGVQVSEPMVFGIGSGPKFYYLFFARGPSTFPLIGIRNKPGSIVRSLRKLCGIDFVLERHGSTAEAIAKADALIDSGTPVAACVDMYRMKYLPSFLRVHAPFHFIALVGRTGDTYSVSDPYFEEVAPLSREDLAAAWETHAPMAKDNQLAYVRVVPDRIDWKRAALRGIRRSCNDMLLPPVVDQIFSFVGVVGMRTYARKMLEWPDSYRGARLRHGILFNAVGFEDQGTGGAAFRLMYGAFLQELSQLCGSRELEELAARLLVHGREWRAASRQFVVLGRTVPMNDEEYDDWYAKNGKELRAGLKDLSDRFLTFADTEEKFFRDLRRAASRLG